MTTKILSGVYYGATYKLTSPVTTLSVTTTGYLTAGVAAAGNGSYNIVNSGEIRGEYGGVSLAGAGTVTNAGTIIAYSTAIAGGGVILGNGGTVNNTAAGSITGYYGVDIARGTGTVDNQGLIIGYGKSGICLAAGGAVTNGSATNTGATVRGSIGIDSKLAAGTVQNFATVVAAGTSGAAVVLEDGGGVANGTATDSTALMLSDTVIAIACLGQAGTVMNFGTVLASYGGTDINAGAIYLTNGGMVTNGAANDITARLAGTIAMVIDGATATVTNFATIGGALTEIGVIVGGGGTITNGSASDTTALIEAYVGAAGQTNSATVINFGTILGERNVTINDGEAAVLLMGGGSVTNGSSADTKALMKGVVGIETQTIAATVTNFANVVGSLMGVDLVAGGKLNNGSAADTTASTIGGVYGVFAQNATGTVTNWGTIRGAVANSDGVFLEAGGVVINGSSSDHTALIQGHVGVHARAGAKVTNSGTIMGSAAAGAYTCGVEIGVDSTLTNNAGALIAGYLGVDMGATTTVTNFGTIQGLGQDALAVSMVEPSARLNAEAGSVFEGTIYANGGSVVDVVSGVAAARAIDSAGKIQGAGTLSLAGGGSLLQAGVSLLVAEIEVSGPTSVDVAYNLSDSRIWDQTAGTLTVGAGDQMTFTGKGDSFSGTVSGAGTLELASGVDTLGNLTLSAGTMKIVNSTVTVSGAIDLTGSLSVSTPNLIVAAAGVSLTGGGTVSLANSATNSIHGASGTATLTNSDIIRGAGKLGGGTMTLINTAAGTIQSAGTVALTIDTGTATIANAGLIEAQGGGGMAIKSAVANTGTLTAFNGTLTVSGAVSGAGLVRVVGGVADFTSTFSENVAFGSTGRLVLSHGQTYGGTISGFSHTGTTSLDLADIAFSGGTTATYSGTTAAGILTVSDGAHTAKIHLTGNYLAATWTLSAATGGGTHVVDPTAPRPKTAPLVAAMAGFGAGQVAATALSSQAWMTAPPMLAASNASRI